MLQAKNALVTGSTSGIGLGIAKALAAQGANVVINGIGDLHDLTDLCQTLDKASRGRILFHGANLTQLNEIEDMVHFAKEELGHIDILVNNAGIQHLSPIEDFAPESWNKVIALNLTASFHTMRLALPEMKQNNWGRIINVASVHGQIGSINKSAYVASKHGVMGLTKVCALETAETGITANTICPGWVRTELVEKQIEERANNSGRSIEEEATLLLSEKQPSKNFATPAQLGEAAIFLCSDAASQMTGTSLTIDGGWTTQ